MSHPVWVCGLKPARVVSNALKSSSHPVWVCGLKQRQRLALSRLPLSHPVWVCGLKQKMNEQTIERERVTPCMGVWIETSAEDICMSAALRHTLYGCVD